MSYAPRAPTAWWLPGIRKSPATSERCALPVIVFWNFNHFLVVERVGTKTVWLNDPGMGRRTVSCEEFDQSFTGVVLTLEPGPDFRKGGRPASAAGALKRRLPGTGSGLAYLVAAGLGLVVPGLAIPVLTRVFMDEFVIARSDAWVGALLAMMAAGAALQGLLTHMQATVLLRLENKLSVVQSSRFFWHVLRLPVEFFGQRSGAEIGSRVAINDHVAELLTGELASSIVRVAMAGFYAALMYLYSPALCRIAVAIAASNILVLRYCSARRAASAQRLLLERGKLTGIAMNGLGLIETLKASGTESDFFSRWSGSLAKVANAEQELALSGLVASSIPTALAGAGAAAVLGIGGLSVINGVLTAGMLVAFQYLMSSFLEPVSDLVGMGGKIQETRGEMQRLDDVLHNPLDQEASREGDGAPCAKLNGALQLQGLTFGYSRLEPALITDFSLDLGPGSRVALVGGSGSGKSTVAKLVCGLYRPWEGEVLFDGKPRTSLPVGSHELRRDGGPGHFPLRGNSPREPDVMGPHSAGSRHAPGGARCMHSRRHHGAPGRLRLPRGRGGAELLRRPAAAPGNCSCARGEPSNPGPG